MFTYETLIKNIRNSIDEKGLKQKAVASRLGKTEQEFSNMLNFRTKIGSEEIPFIANAIGVPIDELFKTE